VGAWYISKSELISDACQNLTTSMVMINLRLGESSIQTQRLTRSGSSCCTE